METDEQDAYDLAVLLEDIERTLRSADECEAGGYCSVEHTVNNIIRMFDKARMSGVVRYPQP